MDIKHFTEISTFMKHEGLFQEPHLTFRLWHLEDFYYLIETSMTGQVFLQFAVRGFFSICHLEDCALRGLSTVFPKKRNMRDISQKVFLIHIRRIFSKIMLQLERDDSCDSLSHEWSCASKRTMSVTSTMWCA